MKVESYPPIESDQVLDFMFNNPVWLADLAALEVKMAELEPFVKAQYPQILSLCQKKIGHSGEATDVAQAGIFKFLRELHVYLIVAGAASVKYPVWHKFRNPEAWLMRAVVNTLKDYFKKRSRWLKNFNYVHELPLPPMNPDNRRVGRDVIDGLHGSVHCAPLHNVERHLLRLEERAANRAFVVAYRATLPRLSLPRRRAWVLCTDLFLPPDDAEKLLKLKSARAAKAAWPQGMSLKDAARLLRCAEGTVSSNLSRARDDLRRELRDLDPLKASRAPVRQWPQEFLGSNFGRRGSLERIIFANGPLCGPLPVTVSAGPVVWARPASDLIMDYARAMRRPLPIPTHKESVSQPALEIELQDGARRVNLPFPKGLKRISYRCGSYRKGCLNCGEKKRIRTKSGRRMTVYESGYAVFRAYAPNETGWTFWCYECGARDQQCWANCEDELGRAALIRPNSHLVQVYKTEKEGAAAGSTPTPTNRFRRERMQDRASLKSG